MLLLHAITAAEAPGPAGATSGLRGYPLRRIEHGGLAAWATLWEPAAPPLDRCDLLASHRLLLALEDCVPARLPTWVADEAALATQLAERAAELSTALARLHGTAELALSVLWRDVPRAADEPAPDVTDGPGAGTRYLRARQRALAETDERRARGEALRAHVEQAAGPRLLASRAEVCPSPHVALRVALLVPRAAAASVRARVQTSLRRADDVRILVNGPWPPYTFVGLGREA